MMQRFLAFVLAGLLAASPAAADSPFSFAPRLAAGAAAPTVSTFTPASKIATGKAQANASVTVKVNGTASGTVTADAQGAWSYTFPSSPTNGQVITAATTVTSTGLTVSGVTATLRSITSLTQMASSQIANPNSSTQVQSQQAYPILRSTPDVQLVLGNFCRIAPNSTFLCTVGRTVTIGISKSQTGPFTGLKVGGSYSIRLPASDATLVRTDNLSFPVTGGPWTTGEQLFVRVNDTWDIAPANFPSNKVIAAKTYDYNQISPTNALADNTQGSSSFPATRPLSGGVVQPIVAILGTTSGPVVANSGDSIWADSVADVALGTYFGITNSALGWSGIPSCNTGISSQALTLLLNTAANLTAYKSIWQACGSTHMFYGALGADFTNGQTGAQEYGYLGSFKGILDPLGIKLIPVTTTPKTNSTNTAMNGSETITDVQQPDLNSRIVAGNGVGYGWFDAAPLVGQTGLNRWRTDVSYCSALTLVSGGTGYAVQDDIDLAYGVQARVTTVSGGVITAAALRKGGGFYAASPPGTLTQIYANRGGFNTAGTGASFTCTVSVANAIQNGQEGIHPTGPGVSVLWATPSTGFAAVAASLFN